MNLTRDKAIEAMDLLIDCGYDAIIVASTHKNFLPAVTYRVEIPGNLFDAIDMHALCELAESIGLVCRYHLQTFRFENA